MARRKRVQRGFTLVETLVASAVLGVGLALVVGAISVALKGALNAKVSAVTQAALQYEVDKVSATTPASAYTDCFQVDSTTPVTITSSSCPAGYNLRVQVAAPVKTSTACPGISFWSLTATYIPLRLSPPGPTAVCHR